MSIDGKEILSKEEIERRIKKLSIRKRHLLTTAKRARSTLARANAEKKAVINELKRLRNARDIFKGIPEEEAKRMVAAEIRSTKPEDIFPPELEKEFDDLESKSPSLNSKQVIDLNPKDAREIDDDSPGHDMEITLIENERVVDLYYAEEA